MGTVLSISPKNHYDQDSGGNTNLKEEKAMKKGHGMFFNPLSWKKLSSVNHQSSSSNGILGGKGNVNPKGEQSRTRDIHPMVDTNKNIANALCHGAKSTTLSEKKLDLVSNGIVPGNQQQQQIKNNLENDRNVDNLNQINNNPALSAALTQHHNQGQQQPGFELPPPPPLPAVISNKNNVQQQLLHHQSENQKYSSSINNGLQSGIQIINNRNQIEQQHQTLLILVSSTIQYVYAT